MLGALNTAVSGMQAYQTQLDFISNNIANSNTVGYKASHATFSDTFNQTLSNSVAGGSAQVGTGVWVSAAKANFSAGQFQSTGNATDLFIRGKGYFLVKDSSGQQMATRAGDFSINQEGYFITNTGQRLQGYTDAGNSTVGDLRLDPSLNITDYKVGTDGTISILVKDTTDYQFAGRVALQDFQDEQRLVKEGNNLFSNLAASGPRDKLVVPGQDGMGQVISHSLEMSNVDLADEMSRLITTQRGFQANARIVTTSDEMLQEIMNLKH